jgi:hypothetical protein
VIGGGNGAAAKLGLKRTFDSAPETPRNSRAGGEPLIHVSVITKEELMRHASCRTTLDIYTRAVDQQKREASLKVVGWMLPVDVQKFQHPSAPSDPQKAPRRCPAPVGLALQTLRSYPYLTLYFLAPGGGQLPTA